MDSRETIRADEVGRLEDVLLPGDPLVQEGQRGRADHLAWCKVRALACLDASDVQEAFTSMVSDLKSHPKTENHVGIELGMMQLMSGLFKTSADMRRYIEGFN